MAVLSLFLYRVYSGIHIRVKNLVLYGIEMPVLHFRMRQFQILDSMHTISRIKENHLSVCRFGDGEFSVICPTDHDHRSSCEQLVSTLQSALQSKDNNLLVCIPHRLQTLKNANNSARYFWSKYLLQHKSFLLSNLRTDYCYGDSLFSRFYIDYTDHSHSQRIIESIRDIWRNQKIMVVEGSQTCSGVGNDLYDTCSDVQRILCPQIDAFNRYNDILSFIVDNVSKDRLVLLFLGVTATALAYDLSCLGYWAIDLGHVDVEYEWFLKGAMKKDAIPGKFVLEVVDGTTVQECKDSTYLSQVIARIE